MRPVLFSIGLLLIAACDSADTIDAPGPDPDFELRLDLVEKSIPGSNHFSGSCKITTYEIPRKPEFLSLKLDGEEIERVTGATSIEVTTAIEELGLHEVTLDCIYREYERAIERTVEVVAPSSVTVHLRNFTQDGEPYVRHEGPILFVVGDSVLTSDDSVSVDVLPGSDYEIFAGHPDFLPDWGILAESGTGETLGFRDRSDRSSLVHISSDVTIDVFKIRESDITSLSNRYREAWEDTSPSYTIENLRQALMIDFPVGATGRIVTDKLTVWTIPRNIDEGSGTDKAIRQLFVTPGPHHVSTLTGGRIKTADVSDGRQGLVPSQAGCIIEFRYKDYPQHEEIVTTNGAIWRAKVGLPESTSTGAATSYFLQAIGLRGTIGYGALDDYVDGFGRPSEFAKLALKILYASPPGSRP